MIDESGERRGFGSAAGRGLAVDPVTVSVPVRPVPREVLSRFTTVLDVQFWLLGRDIEHPAGNILCRSGFVREPHADGTGPSRYRRVGGGEHVTIWAWGMHLEIDQGACLLMRGHAPVVVGHGALPTDACDPEDVLRVARRGLPCSPTLLRMVCHWFAEYERGVETTFGVAHRVPRPGSAASLAPPRPCALHQPWTEVAALALHDGGSYS